MSTNELDKIFDEVAEMSKANEPQDQAKKVVDEAVLKKAIDDYCKADGSKKAADKEMKASRKVIDEAISADFGKGTREYFGNERKIQVVEQKSYALDQAKCDSDPAFKEAYSRGHLGGITLAFHLDISSSEAMKVISALKAAGLDQVVRDIKHEWKFDGNAADVRKVMESVEDVKVSDFVVESVTTKVSAK